MMTNQHTSMSDPVAKLLQGVMAFLQSNGQLPMPCPGLLCLEGDDNVLNLNLNGMRCMVPHWQYLDEREYSPQPHDPRRGYQQMILCEHGIDGFKRFTKQSIGLELNGVGRKVSTQVHI
jgi:hypothetical protein